MEKERGTKIIALVALCIAVAGLSIGFAAYSNTLTISTEANVKTNADDFSVVFSAKDTVLDDVGSNVSTTGSTTVDTKSVADVTDTVIDNTTTKTKPVIKNLKANFTAPNQKAIFTFYAVNTGLYDAYLNGFNASAVANPTTVEADSGISQFKGEGNYIVCTATPSTGDDGNPSKADAALLENACEHITVTVKVAGVDTPLVITTGGVTGTSENLTTHKIAFDGADKFGEADTITVTIEYADSARVDGDFAVQIGDVSLTYDAVD